jgi:hypothetical protein
VNFAREAAKDADRSLASRSLDPTIADLATARHAGNLLQFALRTDSRRH